MCFNSISILNHIFVHMDHVHNMKPVQLSSSLLYNNSLFPIDHTLMALVYSIACVQLVVEFSPNDYIFCLVLESFAIVYIRLVLVFSPNAYHHILAYNEALRQTILLVLVYSILYNHELHLHNALNIAVYPMTIWLALVFYPFSILLVEVFSPLLLDVAFLVLLLVA